MKSILHNVTNQTQSTIFEGRMLLASVLMANETIKDDRSNTKIFLKLK